MADGQGADSGLLDQCDIAFLLAGNNVTHEKGNLCDDRLLHGGAARLANKKVMRCHKFRHFISPTHQRAKLRQARLAQPLENILPPTGDDRHLQLRQFAEMSEDGDGELRNSTWKEIAFHPAFSGGGAGSSDSNA